MTSIKHGEGKHVENGEVDIEKHREAERHFPAIRRSEHLVITFADADRAGEVLHANIRLARDHLGDGGVHDANTMLDLRPRGGVGDGGRYQLRVRPLHYAEGRLTTFWADGLAGGDRESLLLAVTQDDDGSGFSRELSVNDVLISVGLFAINRQDFISCLQTCTLSWAVLDEFSHQGAVAHHNANLAHRSAVKPCRVGNVIAGFDDDWF